MAHGEEEKGSKWALGFGTGWLNDYPGSAQGRFRFLPFPVVRGTLFRMDRISGVSGDVYNNSKVDFSWNFIFQFPTRSSQIPARRGMPDLHWVLSLGPQLKYFIFYQLKNRLFFRFPVRLNTCTDFSQNTHFCGITFNPGFRSVHKLDTWGELTFRWEAFFHSVEYHRYFYEVKPQFQTPTRPAYLPQPGFLGFVYGLFHSLPFEGWSFSSSLNIYDYSAGVNQQSPLFLHTTNYAAFFAFTFDL